MAFNFLNVEFLEKIFDFFEKATTRIFEIDGVDRMAGNWNGDAGFVHNIFAVISQNTCAAVANLIFVNTIEVDEINRQFRLIIVGHAVPQA